MLYWFGLPVVAAYGRLALVVPLQTAGFAPRVIVGTALTVTVMAVLLLTQPVVLLRTVTVALYVATAALPGTTSTIGVAVNVAFVTSINPAVSAAAL